jgi:hypothetical protein
MEWWINGLYTVATFIWTMSMTVIVRQIEVQNYGKLTISWDNSILPSYCALKANKYVSVCWPR